MMEAKTGIVSLATIGAMVAATWAIDERFARAADVRSLSDTISRQMIVNQLSTEIAVLELRRNSVVDKISEGVARDSKRPGDRAISERYSYELRDVDVSLRDKRRQVDQLKGK